MRILIYGINYAPEPTGIGRYTGEMASWLASAGHEVRAVTAPPYYPAWRVTAGFRKLWQGWEIRDGVKVWRSPLWVPKKPTGSTRLLHLFSFAICSLPALLRQTFWRPEVVFVVAPAFVCAPAGWLVARLSGGKAWLHIQDFEVDAAFRLNLLPKGRAQQWATTIERWVLRRFDRVSTISSRMMEHLGRKGVPAARAELFPNWVDIGAISPLHDPAAYRVELGLGPDSLVALYSGSMAAKQGLHLLAAAARQLESQMPQLTFVLCGEGTIKASLELECAGLKNVRFMPLQPVKRLGELLSLADIHLLPQSDQAADLVMPSKLTGMLASGRPVITTAHQDTELARVVASRGRVVPPGDLAAFVKALQELAGDSALRASLGAAARFYAEDCLARDRVLAQFDQALKACVDHANTKPASIVIPSIDKEPLL